MLQFNCPFLAATRGLEVPTKPYIKFINLPLLDQTNYEQQQLSKGHSTPSVSSYFAGVC